MKIFISWSGERSRIIAEGLNSWLPKVIQAVKPFYSPEIEKGTKGIEEINKTLEGTSFGIICLTPDNIESKWIHYEAGALSKIEGARIWTLLHNLKHSDIVQPLAQFQHTLAKKQDIYKLLDSINTKLLEPLDKIVLGDAFERCWSDFEEILENADKVIDEKQGKDNQDVENIRSDREIINEMLELLRNQQRDNYYSRTVSELPKYEKDELRILIYGEINKAFNAALNAALNYPVNISDLTSQEKEKARQQQDEIVRKIGKAIGNVLRDLKDEADAKIIEKTDPARADRIRRIKTEF